MSGYDISVRQHSKSQHLAPRKNVEALPGVLGNRGIRPFISGEQGKQSKTEGNRETKVIFGNREHRTSRY